MVVLSFVPIVLSLVVLGAHFLRHGQLIVVAGILMLILLLFVRRPWVARLMQIVLVLGCVEWARTLLVLYQARSTAGEPALRMTLILGAVAAVSLGSALLFQTRGLRRLYHLDRRGVGVRDSVSRV